MPRQSHLNHIGSKEKFNDVSLDIHPKWGRLCSSPLPTFSLIIKMWPFCSQGCAPVPACLCLSQASYANKLTLPINLLHAEFFWGDERTWASVSGWNLRWEVSIKWSGFKSPPNSGTRGSSPYKKECSFTMCQAISRCFIDFNTFKPHNNGMMQV